MRVQFNGVELHMGWVSWGSVKGGFSCTRVHSNNVELHRDLVPRINWVFLSID